MEDQGGLLGGGSICSRHLKMDSISRGRNGFEEWAALEFILATNKQTNKQKKHVLGSEV